MRTRIRELSTLVTFPLRFPQLAVRLGAGLGLALSLWAPSAAAQEDTADAEPAWIPSLSIDFEAFDYSTKSTVTNLVNPPAQEGSVSNSSGQLLVRIGGELMGPRFEDVPGQPRLFVQGGVGINTFSASKIGEIGTLQGDTEGDIQLFRITRRQDFIFGCTTRNPPTCITADASDFAGQGSELTGRLETPEWNAALGVAFDVPLWSSLLLQVKPSVTYNYENVRLGGRIRTVVEEPPGPTYPEQEVFTLYEGTGSSSSADHSLGLGLEFDLALWRSTPIRASLYLDTRFLWLLTDPVTTFQDSSATQTSFPDPPPPNPPPIMTPTDPVGAYRVERDSFEFRGGAGVRFSWVGFGQR